MLESILAGLSGLGGGALSLFSAQGWQNLVMLLIGDAALPGREEGRRAAAPRADRLWLRARQHPVRRPERGGRLAAHALRNGRRERALPLRWHLHRHRRDDRLTPLLERPRCCCSAPRVRSESSLALLLRSRPASRTPSRWHRDHRRVDGPTAIYVTLQFRAAHPRRGLGRRLLLQAPMLAIFSPLTAR